MRSSTRVLREGLAVFTVLVAGAGCATAPGKSAASAPPIAAPDPATVRATDAFTLGREAALAGDFECARMYFGEAVEYGPRDEVFSDPKHSYTKTLFAATPRADVASIKARLARKRAA